MNTYTDEFEESAHTDSDQPLGQVLAFVSAKGGAGKTILSATTAYILLQSGMRVVTIDTDFSTRGLSLYLLGSVLESRELNIQNRHCLSDSLFGGIDVCDVTPLKVVRGQTEYHVVISNKEVWQGGVPDERLLGFAAHGDSDGTDGQRSYFKYLYELCERFRQEYDYVILDTRGGYDPTSAAPATISDGYLVVVEADKVSIEQVSGFKKKMDEFADSENASFLEHRKRAKLKGFIINKAIFSVDEKVFPQALAREYDSKTFGVIPMDKDAIRSYQKKSIPQEAFPDSDFSYHSLRAIEHVISPSVNWASQEKKKAFYKFFRLIHSDWRARKSIDLAKQAFIPHFLIVMMALATIFYLFFKKGTVSYSLQAFMLCAGLFALLAVLDAMLGSLGFLRSIEVPKRVRFAVTSAMVVLLLGLSYLALFDLPKTFSQEPLIKRIEESDATIAQQSESLAKNEQELSNVKSELNFSMADLSLSKQSLIKAQEDYNKLQTQIVTLRSQNSAIQRDKDQVDGRLQSTTIQLFGAERSLADCEKRLKACR